MEKRYYNAQTLEETIKVYEREYGIDSATLHDAHYSGDPAVAHIPRFQRSLWAGMWREIEDLQQVEPSTSHSGRRFPALQVP